ncbi:MAG: hypothetical protein H6596_00390 [Flavobacteriales bacterium]|nr:hypothetical protein [Flavobacteriales bacterium]
MRLIQFPKNDFKRVVFFVDDIWTVHQSCRCRGSAGGAQERVRHPHCIFLLAIDYGDVVVKGLEGKFGPKTEGQ